LVVESVAGGGGGGVVVVVVVVVIIRKEMRAIELSGSRSCRESVSSEGGIGRRVRGEE
jgi:hypothetical protein